MPDTPATLSDLAEVMAALRTPKTGCPWDLEQTFETISPYTIEEAYEVADAIARNDMADLKEELGDLLLQVVYHSRIAEEQGVFKLDDVIAGITAKMIRRHPHVFGDAEARSTGAAQGFWERIKAEEKIARAAERTRLGGDNTPATPSSVLDDVPAGMPGLTRAVKLQAKAARVGFDWPSIAPVIEKVREEISELEVEIATAPPGETEMAGTATEEEYGDLLFVLANVGRHLKVDPEAALRRANDKFHRRFRAIEAELARQGKTPAESTLAEMDAIWDQERAADKKVRR